MISAFERAEKRRAKSGNIIFATRKTRRLTVSSPHPVVVVVEIDRKQIHVVGHPVLLEQQVDGLRRNPLLSQPDARILVPAVHQQPAPVVALAEQASVALA